MVNMSREARPVLADNLRRLRRERGVTSVDLARRAALSRATLAQLESGAGNPTLETLYGLANALDASLADLIADAPAAAPRASCRPVTAHTSLATPSKPGYSTPSAMCHRRQRSTTSVSTATSSNNPRATRQEHGSTCTSTRAAHASGRSTNPSSSPPATTSASTPVPTTCTNESAGPPFVACS